MNQVENLKIALYNFLKSYSNLEKFYIGKTANYDERERVHKDDEGYNFMWKVAEGDSDAINSAEKLLISYFTKLMPSKIANKNEGGGGNEKANILYLCVKAKINNVDELFDDTMPIEGIDNPFNLTVNDGKCNK